MVMITMGVEEGFIDSSTRSVSVIFLLSEVIGPKCKHGHPTVTD